MIQAPPTTEQPRNRLLIALAHLPTPQRLAALEDYEERAAIGEYERGMTRAEAERGAADVVAAQHPKEGS